MGCGCCGGTKTVIEPTPKNVIYRSKTPSTPPATKREPNRAKSTRPQRESSAMKRFSKTGVCSDDPNLLIDGYLDEPLLTLEEALKPVDGTIDQLSHHISEAKTKCHFPSKHNLTRDESAAIYIYTMNWGNDCLFDQLQAALNSGKRYKVKPWFKYLKLLRSALNKLPDADTEIWQGSAFTEEVKEKFFKSPSLYSSLASCSPSFDVIKSHLQQNDGSKSIYVVYDSIGGKVVTDYTVNNSKEVMIFPGTKVGVAKVVVIDSKGSLHIHITQIEHPELMEDKIFPPGKHFMCPHKGCGNRCPDDHTGDHCHGFAILLHACRHHCDHYHKCDKCGKLFSNVYKCYNCGRCYCAVHCFK